MKKLDAAIDYAHMIVPMIDESDTKEMWRSIEYYLTAHKKIQPVIEKIALGRIEDVIDTIDNSPLTWDELKVMEGKPVWVERPEWKEWLLISEIDEGKCEIYLRDKWGNGAIVNGRNIGYWRAYRKEKE